MTPERRELLKDPDKFSRAAGHDIVTIKNLAGKLNLNDLDRLHEVLTEMKGKVDVLEEFIGEALKAR